MSCNCYCCLLLSAGEHRKHTCVAASVIGAADPLQGLLAGDAIGVLQEACRHQAGSPSPAPAVHVHALAARKPRLQVCQQLQQPAEPPCSKTSTMRSWQSDCLGS